MFTATKPSNKEQQAKDYVCLSTDTKPTTGIANGSLCLEMDTGKIYAFNETASTWIELA